MVDDRWLEREREMIAGWIVDDDDDDDDRQTDR